MRRLSLAALVAACALAGCGGGGGGGTTGGPPPPGATPTPVPTATPFPGATTTLADVASNQTLAAYAGYSGFISLSPPTGEPGTAITELTSLIPPVAVPAFPPDPSSGATPTALVYVTLTASTAVVLEEQPTLVLQLPSAPPADVTLESAYYDSANPSAGWVVSTVPRESAGATQVTLAGSSGVVDLTANAPYVGVVLEVPKSGNAAHARR